MSAALQSYAELVLRAERGVDYDITVSDRGATVTVLALHGGGIAPLTGELATEIAGEWYNLYLLRGLRAAGNEALRLPSLRYSELRCDGLLSRSLLALAVTGAAGCTDDDAPIQVSGQSEHLVAALMTALTAAGFAAKASTSRVERLALQCYNRAQQGGAVLALPWGLRQSLVAVDLQPDAVAGTGERTTRWHTLVGAVRQGIGDGLLAQSSDLAMTLARFERTTRAAQAAGLLGPGARRHMPR
jgi:phage replication-related protein YjqB (UPF0714/DUF867 family)